MTSSALTRYYFVVMMTAKKGNEEMNDKDHNCGSDEYHPTFFLIVSNMGLLSEGVWGARQIVIVLCFVFSYPITKYLIFYQIF